MNSDCRNSDVYLQDSKHIWVFLFNSLNAELNPICHLLALLGAHPILHISRIRVNFVHFPCNYVTCVKSNTDFLQNPFKNCNT